MTPTPMAAPPTGLCKWCHKALKKIDTKAPRGPWYMCAHCDRPCEEHNFCRTQVGP